MGATERLRTWYERLKTELHSLWTAIVWTAEVVVWGQNPSQTEPGSSEQRTPTSKQRWTSDLAIFRVDLYSWLLSYNKLFQFMFLVCPVVLSESKCDLAGLACNESPGWDCSDWLQPRRQGHRHVEEWPNPNKCVSFDGKTTLKQPNELVAFPRVTSKNFWCDTDFGSSDVRRHWDGVRNEEQRLVLCLWSSFSITPRFDHSDENLFMDPPLFQQSLKSHFLWTPLAVCLMLLLSTLEVPHLLSPVNLFGMLVEDTVQAKLFIVAPVSPLCFFYVLQRHFSLFERLLSWQRIKK